MTLSSPKGTKEVQRDHSRQDLELGTRLISVDSQIGALSLCL